VLDTAGAAGTAEVRVSINGEQIAVETAAIGQEMPLQIIVPNAGQNIVELSIDRVDGELTDVNNHAIAIVDGIRENLRVLLVSGEPHAGERTWRNLLKSDASVDLVHFTILRPPEKQDGTPINELSLIAFPTRELFQIKIREFDLIIFDRYAQQGVLPLIYFENIVRYVRNGGAMLIAAGPDYAGRNSVWRTPLEAILPATPTGNITETAYRPGLTDEGKRHPVTRALPGSETTPPQWSRFFRLIDAQTSNGTALMNGPGNQPLLVLSRHGDGRVALLLSDHIWLWARGYEGGGPHLDLLRRLSHWLMKQPELEEEALTLVVEGADLVVRRQTMADKTAPVTVTSPDGKTRDITLRQDAPGLWTLRIRADQLGLWAASDGTLKTLVNVGPANPREFSEVTSTIDALLPIARASGGDARRLIASTGMNLPRIEAVRSGTSFHGEGWLGLSMREASVVRGIGAFPVFAGLLGLLLLIGALTTTWLREGR